MHARLNLSHELEHELRRRIARGVLRPGSRLNEVHLARELSVSRTPLREALGRLAGESFVETRARHGFFVRRLTSDEVREIYPIRARLDPWALELAGLPTRAGLAALTALNERLRRAKGEPDDVIDLDDQWHLDLVASCANPTLIQMIRTMMWRTRRYECACLAAPADVLVAVRQHAKILDALRRGDLPTACRELEANLTSAIPKLVRQLDRRKEA